MPGPLSLPFGLIEAILEYIAFLASKQAEGRSQADTA